ncbi:MAG: hypothetical protein AB7I30_03665 [Isosphaeraceae bacterium]
MTQVRLFHSFGPSVSLAVLLAWLAVATPRAEADFAYQITEVPTLAGGAVNFANDINNLGQVVGNSRKGGAGTSLFPYVWRVGSASPTEIGILPGVPTFGRGFAVNDSGVVVGESGNGPSKGFRWEAGTLSDVGTLPGGTSAVANDVNSLGRIVGSASNGQSVRAFYTDGGGNLVDLGTPLGTTNSLGRANALNDAGVIAGSARNAAGTATEATVWTFDSAGNPVATTVGSPLAGAFSELSAINDLGLAVGRYTNAAGRTRAFAFNGQSSFDLGLLSDEPAFVHARANDVNNAGEIVGYVAQFDTAPSFGGAAVLWRGGSMYDLNDLIDPASGWRLLSAEGINDAGQIVGFGSLNGQSRAFVLTAVPEPSPFVLVTLGAFCLSLRGRRKPRAKSNDLGNE